MEKIQIKDVSNLDQKAYNTYGHKTQVMHWSSEKTPIVKESSSLPFLEQEQLLTAMNALNNALAKKGIDGLNDAIKALETAELFVSRAIDSLTGRVEAKAKKAEINSEIAELEAEIAELKQR